VVLVGAGFSLNAKRRLGVHVPLWSDMKAALEADLGVPNDAFDTLSLVDFYRRELGDSKLQERLLALLPHHLLEPGEAHEALWQSKPEAVITTNFLDTLLERPNALSVVEDTDLALPLSDNSAHLIYFHGHRGDFTSWVIGRSDYEDLAEKRPMLFSRVRQLFAQFPLLVVGYSLTDPDFHLVYRQMVRCMGRRHPMGLAVLAPTSPATAKHGKADAVPRRYWDGLNLRIVRLKNAQPGNSLAPQFRRFFELTKRLDNVRQLEPAYEQGLELADMARCLVENTQAVKSAFADPNLERVWETPNVQHSFWMQALDKALVASVTEWVQDKLGLVHRLDLAGHESLGSTQTSATQAQLPELDRASWLNAAEPNQCVGALWELMRGAVRSELAWTIEALLKAGGERTGILDWLAVSIDHEHILDASHAQSVILTIAALLECQVRREFQSSRLLGRIARLAEARFPDLSKHLQHVCQVQKDQGDDKRPIIEMLETARNLGLQGRKAEAATQYEMGAASARQLAAQDSALLEYFAEKGRAEMLSGPWRPETEADTQLRGRLKDLRQRTPVSRWFDALDEVQRSARKERLEDLEDSVARDRYEPTSLKFSSAGANLHRVFLDAQSLGAPAGILRDIVATDSRYFGSLAEQLEIRLNLNVKGTPKWLAREIEAGEFAQDEGAGMGEAQETSSQGLRVDALRRIAGVMVPLDGELPSGSRATSRVESLGAGATALGKAHVERAVRLLSVPPPDSHERWANAWASLARVTSWSDVGAALVACLGGLAGGAARAFAFRAGHFPWEHWVLCDNFAAKGGDQLLVALAKVDDPLGKVQAGWALAQVFAASGAWRGSPLVEIRDEWLNRMNDDIVNGGKPPLGWESTGAVVATCLQVERWPKLLEAIQNDGRAELSTQLSLAQSRHDTPLRASARAAIQQGAFSASDLSTFFDRQAYRLRAEALVALLGWEPSLRERVTLRLLELLETTSFVLPELAPIISGSLWEPTQWTQLLRYLRNGGGRFSASWTLQRMRFVLAVLGKPASRAPIVEESGSLAFLRHAIVEALSSGDALSANSAIYALAYLAPHVTAAESAGICMALEFAACDKRIGVAHGAAFAVGYIRKVAERYPILPNVRASADRVHEQLLEDDTAIIARQLVFGEAVGRRELQALDPASPQQSVT
jgi:hypothetical protein